MEVSPFPTTKVNKDDIENAMDNKYDDDAGSVKNGVTAQLKTGTERLIQHISWPSHRELTQNTRVELWSRKVSQALCAVQYCAILLAADDIGAFEVAFHSSRKIKPSLAVERKTSFETNCCKLSQLILTLALEKEKGTSSKRDGSATEFEEEEVLQGGRGGGGGVEGGEDGDDADGDVLHLRPHALLLLCPLHRPHGRHSLLHTHHGDPKQNQAKNGLNIGKTYLSTTKPKKQGS